MVRWADLWRDLERRPEIQQVYAERYPYAEVALAVVDLRGRHELTQRDLAETVGTTQSVIARLESGRHPVELRMIHRIAEAVSEPWHLSFGSPSQGPREADPTVDASVGDDPLLGEFNAANTSADFRRAAAIAKRIGEDPSTPRRKLALALVAHNEGEPERAEAWAGEALRGDLPPASKETATLVRARALTRLGRARSAVRLLRGLPKPAAHGWLISAALAEAHLETGQARAATAAADRAVIESAGSPEARYLAARIAWHDDRVWDALNHVAVFRSAMPDDLHGQLLHGAILGYLGEHGAGESAYRQALELFRAAIPSGNCEALRLYAMTAARLGKWPDAFRKASALLRVRDHDDAEHRHSVDHVVETAVEHHASDDPGELEHLVDDAERRFGADEYLSTQRAIARAVRGDLDGTLAAVGLEEADVDQAPVPAQIAVAAAHSVRGEHRRAFAILDRNRADLTHPVGLVKLATTAIAAEELAVARSVLEELATSDDPIGELANIAIALLDTSQETAEVAERLELMVERSPGWQAVVGPADRSQTPAESTWEGAHTAGSAILDRLTRPFVN